MRNKLKIWTCRDFRSYPLAWGWATRTPHLAPSWRKNCVELGSHGCQPWI